MKPEVTKATTATKALAAALTASVAMLLAPAAASAASYVLRPTSTQALQPGWSATPSSSSADGILSKAVSQPAAPDLSSYLSVDTAGSWVAVGVSPPPAFAAGETLSQASAWAYVSSDPSQPVTLSLWTGDPLVGYTNLGSTTVPGGQPGGWYSVSTHAPLDPTQLDQLVVALQGGGSAGTARVFAAYAELDTTTPAPPPPPSPSTGPAVEVNNVPSDVSIVSPRLTLTPHQSDVPVELGCDAAAVGGCHGVLVLRALSGATAASAASTDGQVRAVAARCARGCRILGKKDFTIAAGRHKRVSVHLAHSARHLVRSHRSFTAQAVAISTDGSGNTQITKATVTLSQRTGTGTPPASGPSGTQPASSSRG